MLVPSPLSFHLPTRPAHTRPRSRARNHATPTRLNANPKQIGNLWDGTDTDNTYVYFPIYDFNHNIPDTATSLQYAVSNLADLLRRTTTDNDE